MVQRKTPVRSGLAQVPAQFAALHKTNPLISISIKSSQFAPFYGNVERANLIEMVMKLFPVLKASLAINIGYNKCELFRMYSVPRHRYIYLAIRRIIYHLRKVATNIVLCSSNILATIKLLCAN